jgi:signal transduction histidine kinase
VSWPEPALFLWGLFVMTTLGALLPLDVGRRQDHIVLTITATVALALLGPRGLVLIWGAVVVAFLLRRAGRWLPGTAAAITVGFSLAHLTYAVLLDRSYPLRVDTGHDFALAGLVLTVAWTGTMSVRVALHRLSSGAATADADEPEGHDGFDAFASPLVPYLLPTVAGAPILAAAIALYRRDDPWSALAMLLWCLPLYGASRFDLHRQRLALGLRREALARQRLAAIGEVTARIVHQSRHQAGLMGWSIHRLRRLVGDPSPEGTAAARRELDVLAAAKQHIQETFDRELLHEPSPATPAGNGDGAPPPTLAGTVHEVCAQLADKAQRLGIALDVRIGDGDDDGPGTAPVEPALREVLFNLVDNATDAARTLVRITATHPATGLTIEVTDDGAGPGEAAGARLYEPFFTTKTDGAGMGLAIADALVAELGGRLRHERRAGTTAFVVALPASGYREP